MKILLWGIYSPWTMNFVEHFLIKSDYEIWTFNRGNQDEYKKYINFYKEKGVHLIEFPKLVSDVFDGKGRENYFKVLYSRLLKIKTILKEGPFDLISMQFVDYMDIADAVILKYLMKTKLVLSYWGSDLFRETENRLSRMGRFVRHADYITFDNWDLEIKFKKTYKWSDKIPSKTVLFGLPVLDIIADKRKNENEKDIRKKWRIPNGKTVIAVGYNGIPQQQHKRVLQVIKKLDEKEKNRIVILLQMSYGGTKEYRRSVVSAARRTGCECIDIQRFLTDGEVAELRIVTDIYINAQTTDAFSGSVCENLFAGTVLVNAEWLRYKEFEKYDFQYLEFGEFGEIAGLIRRILEQKPDVSSNEKLVWGLRSWERCAPKWEKVYRRMYRQCRKQQ
nr:hypothetical protein [uncultured Schaedlerella sp.]